MTNTWTASPEHPGYRTKTITRGNCTIVVHRPVLTEKERIKREGAVEHALTALAKKQYIEERIQKNERD